MRGSKFDFHRYFLHASEGNNVDLNRISEARTA